MRMINEKKFLKLMEQNGLVMDERCPGTRNLTFRDGRESGRFWCIPCEGKQTLYFIACLLYGMGEWDTVYVWKHQGYWAAEVKRENRDDDVQAVIYRGIGIPPGHATDVLQFGKKEEPEIIALMFNQLSFGWCVADDVYVIPDHAECFLKTDHHDVVHVTYPDEERMNEFVRQMKEDGFELPAELPGATFKKPDWMA